MTDRNVEAVRQLLLDRSEVGMKKYGTTTCNANLSLRDWLQHALLEGLDKCVYQQAAIAKIDEEEAKKKAAVELPPTPPDHGPKLCKDAGFCRIKRRQNGVDEWLSTEGTWHPFISDAGWGDAPSALHALAKATGYEIKVEPHQGGGAYYTVMSGAYSLNRSSGEWELQTCPYLFLPYESLCFKRDCEARGHYPEAMCDRGEVGNEHKA